MLLIVGVSNTFIFSQEQPSLEWVNSTEFGIGIEAGLSVTVDSASNVYEVGQSFKGGLPQNGAPLDAFIKKFSPSGELLWSKAIHGTIAKEIANCIRYDKRGYLLITGYFQATVDFDPGAGVFNLSGIANEENAFLLCLDTDGNFVYAKKIGAVGSGSSCVGNALSVDNNGNIYLTGNFYGTVDFDPGTAVNTLTTTSNRGILFLAKYDPLGNYIYAKTFLTNSFTFPTIGRSIAIDYNGDILIGGVDYPRAGYIGKLSPGGTLLWERYLVSNIYADVKGVAVDRANNLFITGVFIGPMYVDPLPTTNFLNSNQNTSDIFLLKYNTGGTRLWSFGMGSPETYNIGDRGNGIFVDNNNDVLICGQANGVFDIDPGPSTVSIANKGLDDAFVAKYSNSGTYIWHKLIAGLAEEVAYAVTGDKNGAVFTTGNTGNQEQSDFDPDAGIYNLPPYPNNTPGGGDFIHKMSLLPIPQVINIPNQCHQAAMAKGKLLNPLLGANKTITVDGTAVPYTPADSSFTYFTGSGTMAVGNHVIRVMYSNPGGNKIKDTGYVVNASVSPSAVISASSMDICNGQTISFTSVTSNAGTPQYQWKVNGINVGNNAPAYQSNTLTDNARVQLLLTSTAACAFPATVPSNAITVTVRPNVVPSIAISGNTILHAGQSSVLTAAIQNGGTAPIYQWQDSTGTHNWSDITGATQASYNYIPLTDGDRIRCILTSNANCASPIKANSNDIRFILSTNYRIKVYPSPAVSTITIDSLNVLDRWATAAVTGIDGRTIIAAISIQGKAKTNIPISHLPAGIYVLVLRKEDATTEVRKFVKQ